ncbi:MAG: hypothetical protein DDG60_16530 [Anaerolineae bacterium]|nr:MAG: hypothetical protein DDG60_16530 [Anaerolineae bacterium]
MTPKQFANEATTTPKVLFVDLSHRFGGSSTRALGQLSLLPPDQAGLAVIQDSPVCRQAHSMGLTVHVVGRSKTDWRIWPNLVRLVRQHGYQIVDTQNIQSKFWASLAVPWTGAVLISTLNSWYVFEHGKNWRATVYTALELLTNFRLGGYITVSKTVQQAVQAAYPHAPFVELIYNAVDIPTPLPMPDRAWLAQTFSIPHNALICLAVGRLVWAKGYEDLIEAMSLAAQQEPSLHCLIIGEGNLRASLETLLREKHLTQRVTLAGYHPPEVVFPALRASDIFVMSSRQEGTPIALLEAAARALPIVATSCGGIPELVTDEQHALLVPPGRPDLLAQSLLRLARDPALRQRLGQAARAHVQAHFSLQAQVQATLAAYRKALG